MCLPNYQCPRTEQGSFVTEVKRQGTLDVQGLEDGVHLEVWQFCNALDQERSCSSTFLPNSCTCLSCIEL